MWDGLGFTEMLKEINNAQNVLIMKEKLRIESCKIFGK